MPDLASAPTRAGGAGPSVRGGDELRDRASAEAMAAQSGARAMAAMAGVAVQVAIILALPGHGSAPALLVVTAVYLLFVGAMHVVARSRGALTPALVTLSLAGDLAFIFVGTAMSTSPAHYERSLFGAMVVIHVSNFYFGRRQAWRMLGLAFVAYLALIVYASERQLVIDEVEELWTLALGAIGTILVIAQAGHVRQRLRTIVALFERAEQGDFSETYDEAADRRYDAITRVGRAYNRVHSHLASMVLSDPLTDCLNRRGFEQALAREIARASRAGTELALLVLDLDHFKLVNDTYGHPAGDDVLRAAGRLLLQTARLGDIVARVGGEEFAILLPAMSADDAMRVATQLCHRIRSHPFSLAQDADTILVTTSIGVAAVTPRNSRDSAADASVLSHHADIALYAAKRSGRDRACSWSAELEIAPRSSGPHDIADVTPLGLV